MCSSDDVIACCAVLLRAVVKAGSAITAAVPASEKGKLAAQLLHALEDTVRVLRPPLPPPPSSISPHRGSVLSNNDDVINAFVFFQGRRSRLCRRVA